MRPILTGVLVTAVGAELTMVATDSYRLSVKHTELEQPSSGGEFEANIPARAMRELSRLVPRRASRRSRSRCTRNQIVFRAGGIVLASRLIEGQFPNYRQLLPETFEHEVRAARARSCSTSPAGSASSPSATRRCGSPSPRAS